MAFMGDNIGELSKTEMQFFNLLEKCKEVEVFRFDDIIVFANKVTVMKRFFNEKPDAKFRIWLIDNYKTISGA